MRDVNCMTNILRNSNGILEIDDIYKEDRIKAFFCLDDKSESENDSIFNYLMTYRDESPLSVMICLKLLGDLLKKDYHALNYVSFYASVNIENNIFLFNLIRNWFGYIIS